MTPNQQTIVTDHSQLISDLVVTARATQSVLAQSSHEARASALQHASTLICAHADEIMAHNRTDCLLYTSPSPRDLGKSRMPSSA